MSFLKRPFTAGGILTLTIVLLLAGVILFTKILGWNPVGKWAEGKRSQAVYSTLEKVDDLALLDCAVYRIRVVYPYDLPTMPEELPIVMGRHDFCVLSAQITAGYDLSSLTTLGGKQKIIFPTEEGITVNLGKPIITSFTIADQVVQEKGFPDMAVTPGEWKIIVEAMSPLIEQMARDHGIMKEAEKYGQEFILHMFEGAGYDNIIFTF